MTQIFDRNFSYSLLVLAMIVSIIAWYLSYTHNLALSYNDAMSHLTIARLVVDNQEPGISQIGSVWLPLNHLLPIVFVWNDWLWRTGLAGSIFSMISYVVSLVAIYQTVLLLSKKKVAAFVSALAFGLNFNMLYLQSTPLTEPLYIAIFSLSVFVITKYFISQNARLLPMLGFLGFLQVIARYDGWFVVGVMGLALLVNELFVRRKTVYETLGKLLLFGLPVALGVAMWLLWNALIFGDPLFFAFGPYSAHAQQATIEGATRLITKGDFKVATLAYLYAIRDNVGIFASLLSLAGLLVFLFLKHTSMAVVTRLLVLSVLISPIIFNILALFLGFSILNLPELNWNPSGDPSGFWFNVRYGILALPFAAVLTGLFAGWRKLAVLIAIEVILLQSFVFTQTGVITITDGTRGSSAFREAPASKALKTIVKPNDVVLMSMSAFNPIIFHSDIPLKQFIHEGVSRKWGNALSRPNAYATVIVMSARNDNETVRKAMIGKNNKIFKQLYDKVYSDQEIVAYRLKNS